VLLLPCPSRSPLKKVLSSDIGVEASSQVHDIFEYACGLIGPALISTENPNLERASSSLQKALHHDGTAAFVPNGTAFFKV
jgi:hypothetical protein